jgi:Zn-dependent M28 family amino/carboxypeptidase
VSAHSYICSVRLLVSGASDDASGVAVILEVMRALIARKGEGLAAPVLALFTGGEETLMQVRCRGL